MGDAVFGNMTIDLITKDTLVSTCGPQLSTEQYEQWKRQFCWQALQGVKFGEAFCSHFHTIDNILMFERDIDRAEKHIRTYYISK